MYITMYESSCKKYIDKKYTIITQKDPPSIIVQLCITACSMVCHYLHPHTAAMHNHTWKYLHRKYTIHILSLQPFSILLIIDIYQVNSVLWYKSYFDINHYDILFFSLIIHISIFHISSFLNSCNYHSLIPETKIHSTGKTFM